MSVTLRANHMAPLKPLARDDDAETDVGTLISEPAPIVEVPETVEWEDADPPDLIFVGKVIACKSCDSL